jgi:hypothetical protein
MAMRFTPKTEKEINEERLMPEGDYPFTISGAESKQSKKGNDMIELTLRVYKPDGKFNLVTDYLMEAMLFKLLHCCQACGLEKQYEQGLLEADMFIGKTGMLKLKVDPENGGFPAKNSVKDYIKDAGKVEIPKDGIEKILPENDDLNDEIPF